MAWILLLGTELDTHTHGLHGKEIFLKTTSWRCNSEIIPNDVATSLAGWTFRRDVIHSAIRMTTFSDILTPEKGISTCPHGEARKVKQGERKRTKRVRNAQLLNHTCCPDSQGSHREPCHRVAYGSRPAKTHLYDGYTYPYSCLQSKSGMMHNGTAKGQSTVWFTRTLCKSRYPEWYPQTTVESFVKWSSTGLLHSPADCYG